MGRITATCLTGICSFWALIGFAAAEDNANRTQHPNIIFIIADDMYPHMFNNLPESEGQNLTPTLDRLIGEGSFLSNLYVASPVCTPSRYNVLTGTYASRAQNPQFTSFTEQNEGQTVIQWNSFIMPGLEETVGSRLQDMGYRTGFVGKNHVVHSAEQRDGSNAPYLDADPKDPEIKAMLEAQHQALVEDIMAAGFDFADSLYHDNPNWLGIRALAYQNMDWITDAGVRFIVSEDERPMFLYFATTLPHAPSDPEHSWKADPRITAKGVLEQAPDVQPARDTLPERVKESGLNGQNQENLLWLDDAVGALVDTLEAEGKLENTIIIFFNDHGQESKGTLYEGGIRSQAFVWQQGGFDCGSVCDMPVANIDFLETILDLAGDNNEESYSDGVSFANALAGESYKSRETMYFELGYARAVVKGDYKYLALRYPDYAENMTPQERATLLKEYSEFRESFGQKAINDDPSLPFGHLKMVPGGGGAEHKVYSTKEGIFARNQLYNLAEDPDETVNLAEDPAYADKMLEMKAALQDYIDDLPGDFEL